MASFGQGIAGLGIRGLSTVKAAPWFLKPRTTPPQLGIQLTRFWRGNCRLSKSRNAVALLPSFGSADSFARQNPGNGYWTDASPFLGSYQQPKPTKAAAVDLMP